MQLSDPGTVLRHEGWNLSCVGCIAERQFSGTRVQRLWGHAFISINCLICPPDSKRLEKCHVVMAEYASLAYDWETTDFALTPERNEHHRSELNRSALVGSDLTRQHHLQNIPACFRGSENCLGPAARLLDDVTVREGEMCLEQARIIHSRHMRNGETGANN